MNQDDKKARYFLIERIIKLPGPLENCGETWEETKRVVDRIIRFLESKNVEFTMLEIRVPSSSVSREASGGIDFKVEILCKNLQDERGLIEVLKQLSKEVFSDQPLLFQKTQTGSTL